MRTLAAPLVVMFAVTALSVLFGVLFAVDSAVASEVGTQKPSNVETTEKAVELALTEKGASTTWTVEPIQFEATSHQTSELNARVEKMNAKISKELDAVIAEKLEQSLIN